MTYVLVVWDDAHCELERITAKDAALIGPVRTHSVGHMVSQNERGTVIAVDAFPGEPEQFASYHFIPREMIVATRLLAEAYASNPDPGSSRASQPLDLPAVTPAVGQLPEFSGTKEHQQ